jgi:translation initiation factor 5B
MAEILRAKQVQVRIADVGDISKRDVIEAAVVKTHEPLSGAILAFGVKVLPDAHEEAENNKIPIFDQPIIYNLIDAYIEWAKNKRESKHEAEFDALTKPGKVMVLPGCIFRRAKPAIFGVEILGGRLQPKYSLIRREDMNDLGEVSQIQDKGKAVSETKVGMQVAISMDKPVAGRHVFEKDVLYVKVPEKDAQALLTTHLDDLTGEEQEVLKEYVIRMRKKVPFWAGVM